MDTDVVNPVDIEKFRGKAAILLAHVAVSCQRKS
jgi:hypothetical protein